MAMPEPNEREHEYPKVLATGFRKCCGGFTRETLPIRPVAHLASIAKDLTTVLQVGCRMDGARIFLKA